MYLYFKPYSRTHCRPMQTPENWCNMFSFLCFCSYQQRSHDTRWTWDISTTSSTLVLTGPKHLPLTPSGWMTDRPQALTDRMEHFFFQLMWLVAALTVLTICVAFVLRKSCAAPTFLSTSPTVPWESRRGGNEPQKEGEEHDLYSWQFQVLVSVLTLIFSAMDRRLFMVELRFSWGRKQ